MASLYTRKTSPFIWVTYTDSFGKRKRKPTPFKVGEERQAAVFCAQMEDALSATRRAGETVQGPVTVQAYALVWNEGRKARGVGYARTEAGFFEHHINPVLGSVLITELRPRHVRDLLAELKTKVSKETGSTLGARTIRQIIGSLHCLLEEAVVEELVQANPVKLKRGALPKKRDKDPTWRAGAVYTREEIEQLISDPRLPEDHRVAYAIGFLAGTRPGETAALRWEHWDQAAQPLGQLRIAYAWDTAGRKMKDTKTEQTRLVPVHPTLSAVLAAWKLGGWERAFGRRPEPADFILPRRADVRLPRNVNRMRVDDLYPDLELLGLRRRRNYDTRRTLITLAQVDGASKDILRWITHGPSGDIVDVYTTLPWATLCGEISKLRIGLRGGQLVSLPKAASAGATPSEDVPGRAHGRAHREADTKKPPKSEDLGGPAKWAMLVSNRGPTSTDADSRSAQDPVSTGEAQRDMTGQSRSSTGQCDIVPSGVEAAIRTAAAEVREDVAGAITGGRLRDLEARGLVVVDLARLLELLGGGDR